MMQCRWSANADNYTWGGFGCFGRLVFANDSNTVRLVQSYSSQTETVRLVQISSSQTETVRLEDDCRLGVWTFLFSLVQFCCCNHQLLKLIFSIAFFLSLSIATQAQDKEKYLYQDSSVLNYSDKDSIVQPTEDNKEEEKPIVADTILVNNGLYILQDSVTAIKKEKPFAYAAILDSLLKDLQQKQDVNYATNTHRLSAIDRFFSAKLTKIVFWTIAALLLSFIIVKLFFAEGFFQRKSASNNVNVLATEEDAVPDAKDYKRLINAAIEKRDYRLATRYLYLQSLYHLIGLGAISFATDKTNRQYLAELSAKPYQQAFSALTLQYEYAWYGGFVIDENRFANIQLSFTNFNNQLPLFQ